MGIRHQHTSQAIHKPNLLLNSDASVSALGICNEGDNIMTNPLRELKALGQSVWLDDIDRGRLRSGLFERLFNEDGLSC